ncbi:metallophosphoesterase [Bosea sp. BK604]|uniref:metallophosphoesterase family protein n=1 Tax=Bosea sp. BK604 TaxID=2512180 RepID=UPI0010E5A80A|nr:metallophosphoesterase [Bosea sp. BK604]TCR63180.1 calcineurin-like phosphoesterase family protein [Bosea sp. BK604]
MARAVLALLSDPHLSRRRGYTVPAFRHLQGELAALAPAASIVAGDLVFDDCDDAEDRAFAAEAVASLPGEVRLIPGNHDLGDNVAEPWMGQGVTAERLAAFLATHGTDRFALDLASWRIIGLNAQIFGTGFAREEEQWSWFGEAMRDAGRRPVILVLHKPLALWTSAEAEQPNSIGRAAQARLQDLTRGGRVRLVISGHYHHHRALVLGGTAQLWLPSTALIGRASHGLEPFAQRSPGFVALAVDGEDASFAHVATPPALAVDPVQLAALHGEAPRDWPELSIGPKSGVRFSDKADAKPSEAGAP